MIGIPSFTLGSVFPVSFSHKKNADPERTVPQRDPRRVPAETDARDEPLPDRTLVAREEVRGQKVDQERHVPARPRWRAQ